MNNDVKVVRPNETPITEIKRWNPIGHVDRRTWRVLERSGNVYVAEGLGTMKVDYSLQEALELSTTPSEVKEYIVSYLQNNHGNRNS